MDTFNYAVGSLCFRPITPNGKEKSCPCAYLIKHYAIKAYEEVDV
jgi:hypothetical protein